MIEVSKLKSLMTWPRGRIIATILLGGLAYVTNILYYVYYPYPTLTFITVLILVTVTELLVVLSVRDAYRIEKSRATLQQREGGATRFYPVPITYSSLKGMFIVIISTAFGIIAFMGSGVLDVFGSPEPITGFSSFFVGLGVGAFLGYKITKRRWFPKAIFTTLLIACFFFGTLFGYIEVQSALGFTNNPGVIASILILSPAIGGYAGYQFTKTQLYENLESRFLSAYGVYDRDRDDSGVDRSTEKNLSS